MPPNYDFDLLVIGSGPAGKRAAIQGAKLGKQVAIVEKKAVVGGYCVNLGTIPSKTLREAVLELSGYRGHEFYGASYTVKEHITMQDLLVRTNRVVENEIDVMRHQLMRNDVEVICAAASFTGPDSVHLDYVSGGHSRTVRASSCISGCRGSPTPGSPNTRRSSSATRSSSAPRSPGASSPTSSTSRAKP